MKYPGLFLVDDTRHLQGVHRHELQEVQSQGRILAVD